MIAVGRYNQGQRPKTSGRMGHTMMQLDMGASSRRIWIWRGELPDAQYEPVSVLSLRLPAASSASTAASQAAVELRQIAGPHSNYGLLGAEFVPNGTAELAIEVATSGAYTRDDEEGTRWILPSSRPWTGEIVGLPTEHGKAVLAAARNAPNVAQLGGGTLHFDRAAYHRVDSNDNTYARLARIVVRLLMPSAEVMSEQALVDLVHDAMRDWPDWSH